MTVFTFIPALFWGSRFPHREFVRDDVEEILPVLERFAGPFATGPLTAGKNPYDDEWSVDDAKGRHLGDLHVFDDPTPLTFGEVYPELARTMMLDDDRRW